MSKKVLCLLALVLGGSLMFSSCKDNENVTDNPVNPEEEVLEKSSERGEALLGLLSATADLDSLPDDWYKNSYTVEPTIGQAIDPSNPYVRYVSVNTLEEANDAFKRMTSDNITETIKDESWQKDGIGSLTFTVGKQADVLATVGVSVKQMPHLTEIRFVPTSAIGNNGSFDGFPYYQVGDIVHDKNEGSYWICVRPTSKEGDDSKSKSHWISFNLVNDNFKKVTKSGYVTLNMPNDLGKESGSKEHIKNFLNFLKSIAPGIPAFNNLATTTKYEDKSFSGVNVKGDTLRTIASYWSANDFLTANHKEIFPSSTLAGLIKAYTRQTDQQVNVFYYGYASSPGVYLINTTIKELDTKFNANCVKFTWPKGTDESNYDFKKYTASSGDPKEYLKSILALQCSKATQSMPSEALIIRYKIGSALSGKSASYFTDNDYQPAKSFSTYNQNIEDVFVVREKIKQNKNYQPVYAMGTQVKKMVGKDTYYLACIKSGHRDYPLRILSKAIFLCPEYKENLGSTNLEDNSDFADNDIKVAMFHLLNAYISNCDTKDTKPTFDTNYNTSLSEIYNFLNSSEKGLALISKGMKYANNKFTLGLSYVKGTENQQYTMTYDSKTKTYTLSKFTGQEDETHPKVSLYAFNDYGNDAQLTIATQSKVDANKSAEAAAKAYNSANFQ